jgi:AraC-like DNA-binding protein
MIRNPHNALRPFLKDIWVSDRDRYPQLARFRENALPDGHMHIVIRLSDSPIRIVDAAHPNGYNFGFGVIGGARASFYARDITGPSRAIGATLRPGAAQALFGPSAVEFANRHTRLDDLWGTQAEALRARLIELSQPHLQLELFEMHLMMRLPQVKGIHPAVAQALAEIHGADVRALVSRSGVSHRRFIELFSREVGLTPKRFSRVLRLQRLLKLLAHTPGESWASLAADAGFADQPHFNREFREFAGMTPEQFRRAAPESPGHVLLPDGHRRPHEGPDRESDRNARRESRQTKVDSP